MIKKILIGTLLAGLIGLLVFGAINRTLAKNNETSLRENEYIHNQEAPGGEQIQRGQGRGPSSEEHAILAEPQGAASYSENWTTFLGTVLDVEPDSLTVKEDNGEMLILEGRSWAYAGEQGFIPEVGERLAITGFTDDNGVFEAAQLSNRSTGASLALRDANGRPKWSAGRGQAGGRRN